MPSESAIVTVSKQMDDLNEMSDDEIIQWILEDFGEFVDGADWTIIRRRGEPTNAQ